MQDEINVNMSASKAVSRAYASDMCLGGAELNLNWDKDHRIHLAVFHSLSRECCNSTGLVRTESGRQQKAVEQNFVLILVQVGRRSCYLSSVHIFYLTEGHNCFLLKPCQFIT